MKRLCKCLLAMLLLAAITLPMGGCSFSDLLGSSSDHTTGQQGSQGSGQTNNQGSGDEPAEKKPDYSMYSPLLQEVLSDPEYDELYRRYESGEIKEGSTGDLGLNLFEAIPYDFLENKHEDVEEIKSGTFAVVADLYVLENNKSYIYSKLDIYKADNEKTYIHQYLLQYQITEQEIEDFTMLYKGDYFQGPIMFQRLASKQTPKVISEFAITEKAYEKVLNVCNSTGQYATLAKLLNHDKISNFTLTSLDYGMVWDENSFDITFKLINEGNSRGSVSTRTLYKVSSSLVYSTSRVSYDDGILDLESFSGINSTILDSTPITYFRLNHAFKNFKERW